MLNNIPKYYGKFLPLNGDSFIEGFKQFYNQTTNYQQLLQSLSSNLDTTSLTHLNNFLNSVLNAPLPTKNYLVHTNALINNPKLHQAEQKFLQNANAIYTKYNLQGTEKITTSVFKYFNGLSFLPKNVIKALAKTTFLDIGAFFGDSALALQRYKPKHTISFEPNNVNYNNLQQTLKNNLQYNITAHNLAVGSTNSSAVINYVSNYQNHGASLLFKAKKHKTQNVNIVNLNSFLANLNQTIGLLKIDTEGYGLEVIKGANHIIQQHKPIISCAVYHNPQELFYIKPLLQQINPNYNFMLVQLNQQDILKDLTLLAY